MPELGLSMLVWYPSDQHDGGHWSLASETQDPGAFNFSDLWGHLARLCFVIQAGKPIFWANPARLTASAEGH